MSSRMIFIKAEVNWLHRYKFIYLTTLQSFPGRPSVFVSARYTRDTKPNDAMYVWLENVNSKCFEVCIREFLPFDGKHQDTIVVRDISTVISLLNFNISLLYFHGWTCKPTFLFSVFFLSNSLVVVWRQVLLCFTLLQDWFAFVGNGSESNFTLSGEADFPNSNLPTAEDNYGFCQVSVI